MNVSLQIKDIGFRRHDTSNPVQITAVSQGPNPVPVFSFTVERKALIDFLYEAGGIRDSSSIRETTLPGKLIQV